MNPVELCKKCKNRKFDLHQGTICGLTDKKPDFEGICPDFERDETVKEYTGRPLKNNRQRAKQLLSILWIILGIQILMLSSRILKLILLDTVNDGGNITAIAAKSSDILELVFGIMHLVAYAISVVLFILWFRRAYYNLHQKVQNLAYSDIWAGIGWFIPILNLFIPVRIMNELYVETKHYLKNKGLLPDEKSLSTDKLWIWWILWLSAGIYLNYVSKYTVNNIEDMIMQTELFLVGDIFRISLTWVTINVVKEYSKVEHLLIKEDPYEKL